MSLQKNYSGSNTDGSFTPRLFQTRSWVPWEKNPIDAYLGKFRLIFFFYIENGIWVYSLESPRWGDSNENTQ